MKYFVLKYDRDKNYKKIGRKDLEARNKKEAMKEAEEITREHSGKNITIVLYSYTEDETKCVATFKAFAPFFI